MIFINYNDDGDGDNGDGNDDGIVDSRRSYILIDAFFRHKHVKNNDDNDDDDDDLFV